MSTPSASNPCRRPKAPSWAIFARAKTGLSCSRIEPHNSVSRPASGHQSLVRRFAPNRNGHHATSTSSSRRAGRANKRSLCLASESRVVVLRCRVRRANPSTPATSTPMHLVIPRQVTKAPMARRACGLCPPRLSLGIVQSADSSIRCPDSPGSWMCNPHRRVAQVPKKR